MRSGYRRGQHAADFPVELLQSPTQILIGLLFVIGGAVVSYALSCLCDRLQQGQE